MRRRDFLKGSIAGAAASAALGGSLSGSSSKVGVGLVGVGSRGRALTRILLDLEEVEIRAIADINRDHLQQAQQMCRQAGQRLPEGYSRGPEDFKRLVDRNDLDAVVTATPWEWHAPVMLAALDAGKYGATEVPAAVTLDECWALVEKSETTGIPCMMLENWVFRREALAILQMTRAGLLGEVNHCRAGYNHDVRFVKFDTRYGDTGSLAWRGMHSVHRDGHLYPTHPLAPIAMVMDINRGTRMKQLISMSTPSQGMNLYIEERFGKDHPNARRKYLNGDVNSTLIKLENGNTINLFHDTQSFRPRDDGHLYHGTRGIVQWPFPGEGRAFFLDRHWDGEETHQWEWHPLEPFLTEFEHPIWREFGDHALKFGHDGSDWLEMKAFVGAVQNREQTPVTVYDAASWSAVAPLSEASVQRNSQPVEVPDFTRGKWKATPAFELKW